MNDSAKESVSFGLNFSKFLATTHEAGMWHDSFTNIQLKAISLIVIHVPYKRILLCIPTNA